MLNMYLLSESEVIHGMDILVKDLVLSLLWYRFDPFPKKKGHCDCFRAVASDLLLEILGSSW